jgi:DmsE family decaheme c-type cytochrome
MRLGLAGLVGAIMLLAITLLPTPGSAQEKPGAPASPPAPAAAAPASDHKPAEFVGSTTCQMCHEDIFNAFQKNPHQTVETDKKRGFETKACESCHGPGSKHAESASAADILQPAKLKPADADRRCLTCHKNQATHSGRLNSSHANNQVSCTACHSIHKNGPHGLVARKPAEINAQCAACHANIWASFQQPYKHRLPEGAMSCVDCHNPHGSVLPSSIQLTRANEPACAKCHGDKVGPFTFEHAPVRLQGCATCHEPHGSANPRMLNRAEVRYVCMECHSNLPVPKPPPGSTLGTVAPAFHDIRNPRFQNCTLCHQKVHGSYVTRTLTK